MELGVWELQQIRKKSGIESSLVFTRKEYTYTNYMLHERAMQSSL